MEHHWEQVRKLIVVQALSDRGMRKYFKQAGVEHYWHQIRKLVVQALFDRGMRKHSKQAGVEHYWDQVRKLVVVQFLSDRGMRKHFKQLIVVKALSDKRNEKALQASWRGTLLVPGQKTCRSKVFGP